jgi:hypothetical protein
MRQVRGEVPEQLGGEWPDAVADEVVHACAAAPGDVVEFALEQQISRGPGPVEQQEVLPAGQGQRLEQRTHWGDADAAGDEQHIAAGATVRGDGSVRAFGEHPGSGLEPLEHCAAVAEGLDGQSQVGVRGRRRQ